MNKAKNGARRRYLRQMIDTGKINLHSTPLHWAGEYFGYHGPDAKALVELTTPTVNVYERRRKNWYGR